jgi:1-acyl-sn-glycerol-3-phosphate acyltransferase
VKPFKYKHARDLDLPPTERAGDIRREPDHLDALLHPLIGVLLRPWMAVMHRMHIEGREHLPDKPPYVMIANHTSHLDTPALLNALPSSVRSRACPVAAHDTFFTTRAKALLATKCLNVLPLRRQRIDRHALDTLRQRLLEDDLVLMIFPEGTRGDGNAIATFKAGIGMLVAGTDVPVVPCRLRGCEKALPKGHCLPRPTPLSLTIGRPRRFVDVASSREGWETIASELQASVELL